MDSLKVSLLKCTTASETLVMHRTTFLCLSLVPPFMHDPCMMDGTARNGVVL